MHRERPPVPEEPDSDSLREREIWRGSFSAKGMASLWLVALAVTIALPVIGWLAQFDASGWRVIALVLAGGWLVLLGLLLVRKLDVRDLLTTERLVHELGILTRYTHRIELIDIDDVSLQQGILDRLLSVGTIAVHSSDRTDPVLVMPGIDAAPQIAEMIDDARRAERMRRGLYVESI